MKMPPIFLMMFGGLSIDAFVNWVSNNQPTNNTQDNIMVSVVNEDVWVRLKKFLRTYEGYHSKAYDLKDGRITIGYGTTNWLRPNGTVIRAVRLGDTINEVDADLQMKYFFASAVPNLNVWMQANKIAVSPSFLVAILNFCYMSGTGFLSWQMTRRMFAAANGNKNTSYLSDVVKTEMLAFWKSIKFKATDKKCPGSTGYKYQCFGLGWSRRLQASLDVITGNEKEKRYYDINIKKAF